MPQQQTELLNFLQAYYHQTSEMIIFIDAQGQVIDMNEAAKRVISSDNDMSGISTTICGRCEGYTNEHALRTCQNCFCSLLKLVIRHFKSL